MTRGRLDTGADMTVVPAALVAELPLGRFRKVAVQGFRGESETMFTYIVDVSVNGHRIEFVEVVLDESDEAELLVGRDVLNELTVVLDGPALSAEVR
ncbi:MAG: retroviral-like aspartic protease family protein [Chloroflexi bacterium]|nr:retroviral-like aspartic protease family protein [Chloroflexota bacterium]